MSDTAKLAVITGAASGIGAGLSREAARRGYRVLMADYDATTLSETAQGIPGAQTLLTDVTQPEQLDALADAADAMGGADVLFNNAGVMTTGFSWEIPAKDWQQSLAVNVGGAVNGARSFVPRMIARGTSARIVNTSSVGGFLPSPLMAPYSATKFAVVALTEALHAELEMIGAPVAVSLLAPGPVHSAIFSDPFAGTVHPATQQFVDTMQTMSDAHGMAPDLFAQHVFDGVERGDYWIIPQPDMLDPLLDARAAMIRDRAAPSGAMVDDTQD